VDHKEDVELALPTNKLLMYKILRVTTGINLIPVQDNSHQANSQKLLVEDNLDVQDVLIIKKEILPLEGADNLLAMDLMKFSTELDLIKESVPLVQMVKSQTLSEETVNAKLVRLQHKFTTNKPDNMKTNANLRHVIQDHTETQILANV